MEKDEITIWSWIGLACMAISVIIMIACVIWMFTW